MKAGIICFVLFLASVVGVTHGDTVQAAMDRAWTTKLPSVYKNESVTETAPYCASYLEKRMIVELRVMRSVCLEGAKLKFGYVNYTGSAQVVVELPYTGEVHMLSGICAQRVCRYAPEQDTLVTTQQSSQYGVSVTLFKHVSKRVQATESGGGIVYTFDSADPEYKIHLQSGKYVATPTFAMSSNGRWVVAELRDAGMAVIDTETFETKQITTEGYRYGYGMDPTYELAISDDGKSVAATGLNAGFRVFDVDDACGQPLVDNLTLQPGKTNCPYSDFGIGNTFANFSTAKRPEFFGNGRELEVIIESWAGITKRVTYLAGNSTVSPKLTMVSLGDSFSSGEGENDAKRYYVESDPKYPCHVSDRAYPALLASALHIPEAKIRNVACAGAQMSDIFGTSSMYWGQGNRLGVAGLGMTIPAADAAKEHAVEHFETGRALQADFVERYRPEFITVGVGGNDAGLMGKLRACAMPGTCEWASEDGKRKTDDEIYRLSGTLEMFYAHLKDRAANAKILIVGYPQVIEKTGTCNPLTNSLLNADERTYMSESITYLNSVIEAAAAKAGVLYADVDLSYGTQKLCGTGTPSAMNGIRFGDDISVLSQLPLLKIIGSETFHPTPTGHELVARDIVSQHPNLLTESMPMPNQSMQTPSTPHAADSHMIRSFAAPFATMTSDRTYHIMLEEGTLQPNVKVTVELHSEPKILATLHADDIGAVHGDVTVPAGTEEGFHTLHVLTTSTANTPIDLYDFVTVGTEKDEMSALVETNDMINVLLPKFLPNLPATTDARFSLADTTDHGGNTFDASVLGARKGIEGAIATPNDAGVVPSKVFGAAKNHLVWVICVLCVAGLAVIGVLFAMAAARKRANRRA